MEHALEFIQMTITGLSDISYAVDERALIVANIEQDEAMQAGAYVKVRFDFTMQGARLRSTYVVVYRYRRRADRPAGALLRPERRARAPALRRDGRRPDRIRQARRPVSATPPTPTRRWRRRVGSCSAPAPVPSGPTGSWSGPATWWSRPGRRSPTSSRRWRPPGRHGGDVLKTTVYVVTSSQEDLVEVWAVVKSAFEPFDPPSTLLGVTVLGYTGQLVEIEAVALAPAPSEPAPSP